MSEKKDLKNKELNQINGGVDPSIFYDFECDECGSMYKYTYEYVSSHPKCTCGGTLIKHDDVEGRSTNLFDTTVLFENIQNGNN